MMEGSNKSTLYGLISVILLGAISNWVTYQLAPDYSGPFTAAVLVLFCTFLIKQNNKKWADLGLSKMEKPVQLIWKVPLVLVLTIAAGIIANLLLKLVFEVQAPSQSRFEGMEGNLPMFILWVGIGWAVGGFFEEMIFRGFLLNYFERLYQDTKVATILAICSQAFLFGLVHFYNRGITGGLTILVVALILGLLYVKFGRNLWPLIIAHGIIDTLSFLEDYMGT